VLDEAVSAASDARDGPTNKGPVKKPTATVGGPKIANTSTPTTSIPTSTPTSTPNNTNTTITVTKGGNSNPRVFDIMTHDVELDSAYFTWIVVHETSEQITDGIMSFDEWSNCGRKRDMILKQLMGSLMPFLIHMTINGWNLNQKLLRMVNT